MTAEGTAEVTLPDYFEALTFTEDRSVLLTQVFTKDTDELAMLAASRVVDGKFKIRASVKTARVAWEVKAVRKAGTGDIVKLTVVTDKPKGETHDEQASTDQQHPTGTAKRSGKVEARKLHAQVPAHAAADAAGAKRTRQSHSTGRR
jgi:hypothetical protein